MEITELLKQEVHRRIVGEGVPRLRQCLGELSDEAIWRRPNEHSNSVGNLVLHLHGNVRQWLYAGLAKGEDTRQRHAEFEERGPIPRQILLGRLDDIVRIVEKVLAQVGEQDLATEHDVQGFRESGVAILVHVTEHFSYHVGQVVYFTKALLDMDMGFYSGVDLNRR